MNISPSQSENYLELTFIDKELPYKFNKWPIIDLLQLKQLKITLKLI